MSSFLYCTRKQNKKHNTVNCIQFNLFIQGHITTEVILRHFLNRAGLERLFRYRIYELMQKLVHDVITIEIETSELKHQLKWKQKSSIDNDIESNNGREMEE